MVFQHTPELMAALGYLELQTGLSSDSFHLNLSHIDAVHKLGGCAEAHRLILIQVKLCFRSGMPVYLGINFHLTVCNLLLRISALDSKATSAYVLLPAFPITFCGCIVAA